TKFRYIVWLATLFRAIGSSGDTDGSLKAVNSASYDFTSHGLKQVSPYQAKPNRRDRRTGVDTAASFDFWVRYREVIRFEREIGSFLDSCPSRH
ncbi:hypothetical protein, partial [Shewanella hanedai]|uniref:hypothetical protein n=1 Tax=Shewanella hanedai TaxID=25 RepID=UPI001C8F7E58